MNTIQVDNKDRDLLENSTVGIFKHHNTFYVFIEAVRLHRIIYERIVGRKLLENEWIDHKDTDGLNNRRDNLRIASNSQNQANRGVPANNTSGYKGVSLQTGRNKFSAKIQHNGVKIDLGSYVDPIEAARAYDTKARELFGEFARLNFTDES